MQWHTYTCEHAPEQDNAIHLAEALQLLESLQQANDNINLSRQALSQTPKQTPKQTLGRTMGQLRHFMQQMQANKQLYEQDQAWLAATALELDEGEDNGLDDLMHGRGGIET